MLCDLVHGAVASVERSDRFLEHRIHDILAAFHGAFGRRDRARRDFAKAGGSRRARVGDRLRRLGKILEQRRFFEIPRFIRRQGHPHPGRRVGARGLGHHIRDRLRHLAVRFADFKTDLPRIHSPVEDPHLAVFIPRNMLILQHKGHLVVLSFHANPPFS